MPGGRRRHGMCRAHDGGELAPAFGVEASGLEGEFHRESEPSERRGPHQGEVVEGGAVVLVGPSPQRELALAAGERERAAERLEEQRCGPGRADVEGPVAGDGPRGGQELEARRADLGAGDLGLAQPPMARAASRCCGRSPVSDGSRAPARPRSPTGYGREREGGAEDLATAFPGAAVELDDAVGRHVGSM